MLSNFCLITSVSTKEILWAESKSCFPKKRIAPDWRDIHQAHSSVLRQEEELRMKVSTIQPDPPKEHQATIQT